MCKWGTYKHLLLKIPASLSYTGKERMKKCGIDYCIANIVQALNDNGIYTVASCCGHDKGLGSIALADGRELLIAPDFTTARKYVRRILK